MSIHRHLGAGRAIGGLLRSANLEAIDLLQTDGGNDAPNPPGVDELKTTCRNARIVHELCEALNLESGGVFSSGSKHHHHAQDGAFILPE